MNENVELVIEFMNQDEIFEQFQTFLDRKEIESTEAEGIINSLELLGD